MLATRGLVCVLFVLLVADGCHGYAWGPPESACVEMFPYGHHVNASNREVPYEILINATTYSPGDVIEVRVRSIASVLAPNGKPWPYTGIFVQVRSLDCEDVTAQGTFFLDEGEDYLQAMHCGEGQNNAVRHFIKGEREDNTFYWIAPSRDVGHLVVRATITYNKALFWHVFSEIFYSSMDNDREGLETCTPRTLYDPYEFCPDDYRREPNGAGARTYNLAALILAAAAAVVVSL